MTTISNLVDRTFRWADRRGRVDTLSANVLTGTAYDPVTLSVNDITLWGTPMEVEIGTEIFHVTTVDRGTSSATAIRGWRGTTPTSHTSGDIVHVAPRFFRIDAYEAIVDCLRKLTPPLYKFSTTNLNLTSGTTGYELPADCVDVYRLYNKANNATNRWLELYSYTVMQGMDTSSFSTGAALMVNDRFYPGSLRVEYKAAFTDPADETDDLEDDIGMLPFMFDIPVWYAVSVLVPPDEVLRSGVRSAAGQARAEVVEPRSNVSVAEYFRNRYELALSEAVMRMDQLYPLRVRLIR